MECVNLAELRKALRLSLHLQSEDVDKIFQQACNKPGDNVVTYGKL